MTKAAEELETRRRQRAEDEFRQEWWWFNSANDKYIHEFSASWEILRRSDAYRLLWEKMSAASSSVKDIESRSFASVIQRGKLMEQFRAMLPTSPPVPRELCEIVRHWQNMIANGWTPEKTYLEVCQLSDAVISLRDKEIRIPPSFAALNQGVPIILPRQVVAKGHTLLLVESCDVTEKRIEHLMGPTAPGDMLKLMRKYGKPFKLSFSGKYIAVQFTLNHPPQALKEGLKSGLDKIGICEKSQSGDKPLDCDTFRTYHRGRPYIIGTTQPLEIIAFFSGALPRNVIESGFHTLIRPERVKKILPQIRKEWVKWDASERAKFARNLSPDKIMELSSAAWRNAMNYGKLPSQSTARPIRPKNDLNNLSCADCVPFYKRNRSQLPATLPESLRQDADFNKRVKTGCELVRSVDKVFLPLLSF